MRFCAISSSKSSSAKALSKQRLNLLGFGFAWAFWGSCQPPKPQTPGATTSPTPVQGDRHSSDPVKVLLPKDKPQPGKDIFAAVPKGEPLECDLLVLGGSLSGLAAALNSAYVLKSKGLSKKICLTEPTDWVGGQLTSGGVAAVDFAHHETGGGQTGLNPKLMSLRI